jgi:undecaprenyl phosphate N,N'-diacetylbacillosamine 1-phosphate transferase
MYRYFFKSFFDKIIALMVLVVTLPLLLVVVVALYFYNDGKPFFLQERPGLNGLIFKIIKFKTMNDKRDRAGELLPDAARLTPAGRFVRKTSIDELPQLVNVLLGQMSLVGPRPLLVEYLPRYNAHQSRRHGVRPGITGWAQVNGRNAISWEQKFDYDVWYVENLSFVLDLKIIWKTIQNVIRSEGINSATAATMDKFMGS